MIAKVISGILIFVTLYMGIKQGWPMITGKTEMLNILSEWDIRETIVLIMDVCTLEAVILVLFPQTFFYGNAITSIVVVYMITSQLINNGLQAAVIELPFLIMLLLLLWLGHPLAKQHRQSIFKWPLPSFKIF